MLREPKFFRVFLQALVELQRQHDLLARTKLAEVRYSIDEAFIQITASSARSLKAARILLDANLAPEAGGAARPSYEWSRDGAYLLTLTGGERREAMGQFLASRYQRLRGFENAPLDHPLRSLIAGLERSYPTRGRVAPGAHWSGKSKGDIDKAARRYWREEFTELRHESLFAEITRTLPSSIAHGDPGSWAYYPRDVLLPANPMSHGFSPKRDSARGSTIGEDPLGLGSLLRVARRSKCFASPAPAPASRALEAGRGPTPCRAV